MRLTSSIHQMVAAIASLFTAAFLTCCGGGSNTSSSGGGVPPPATPVISSFSPPYVQAGSPSFTLTINGSNFNSSCTAELFWNDGASLTMFPSPFVSSTKLEIAITAAEVAQIGPLEVYVLCPGGSVNAQFLASGFPRIEVDQAANDIVWDPVHQVIYASVPPTVPSGSGIAVLNPTTAQILSFTPLANNPDVLAISDDGQYLYVGLDGSSSIQRFTLPQLTPDIEYPIGYPGDFPYDIQVAPQEPHTIAVSIGRPDDTTPSDAGVAIFDDGQRRPETTPGPIDGGTGTCYCGSLQWGSTLSALYSSNSVTDGFDFYSLSVSSTGVVLSRDYPSVLEGFNGVYFGNIHYLSSTGLIYSDDLTIIDPSGGTRVGTFSLPATVINEDNRMVPDSDLKVAAFLFQSNDCGYDGIGVCLTVATYSPVNFNFINSLEMSDIKMEVGAINMIRWGNSGLAFNTDTGQIYLVDISTLLQPAAPTDLYRHNAKQYSLQHHHRPVVTTTKKRLPPTVSKSIR